MCDSPARKFISGTKNHGAKKGCHKCMVVGENAVSERERIRFLRPTGRIVYLSTTAPLRTNYSFRGRTDPEHHKFYIILEELEILDVVLDFPSDPMHLVDEGVGKKFFITLLEDSEFKVSPLFVRRINEDMSKKSKYTL